MQICTHVKYEDCRETVNKKTANQSRYGQPGSVEVRGRYCSDCDVLVVVQQQFAVFEGFRAADVSSVEQKQV